LGQDPTLEVWAEAASREYVDPSTEQLLEILLEGDHIEQRSAVFDIYKEIDVAVGAIVTTGD
jgi:hypothetical protein